MAKLLLGPFTKDGYFFTKNPTNVIKARLPNKPPMDKKDRRPGVYDVFGHTNVMWMDKKNYGLERKYGTTIVGLKK